MAINQEEIIIQSLTRTGKPFRPSDWVDRICSSYATFGEDRKLRYSPYLKPEMIDGIRCLAVDLQLKATNPDGFEELMQFAEENQLNILNSEGESIATPESNL
ncbi:MAG: DUF3579 domain-containing protein [Methylophilaceae bacterium]|nr:DUF3579 domain-containing protein [Methylophilaceae bacterium]MDG1821165.1 DUF3579 domain-containing protein [Methylophilaceae bacterium]